MNLSAVRPLAEGDDRARFDCNRESLNRWLARNAWRNQRSGMSRTYIIADDDAGRIAGFAALTVGDIRRDLLNKPDQRNAPDPIPVLLLGQLAVDKDYQGQGVSKLLLAHTFQTAITVAKEVGAWALLTHPLDDTAEQFYRRWGFQPLEPDPRGAFYVRIKDLKNSGFA